MQQIIKSSLGSIIFDFYMIEAKPENLIGDCAFDSERLDEELHARAERPPDVGNDSGWEGGRPDRRRVPSHPETRGR
jgi:hypothetical protein